jgi:hypothetical protein
LESGVQCRVAKRRNGEPGLTAGRQGDERVGFEAKHSKLAAFEESVVWCLCAGPQFQSPVGEVQWCGEEGGRGEPEFDVYALGDLKDGRAGLVSWRYW